MRRAAFPAIGTPEYGSLLNWSAALVVILVTLALKFFTRGMLAVSAVLIGLLVGYIYAILIGMLPLADIAGSWERSAAFALPQPFRYGFEFSLAAIVGFCLMAFVSAVETVGDVSGITKGGAGREATDAEITGATYADGLGTALAGIFGGFPKHLVQPECRADRDDRGDEPPCRDLRRDLPDHLRSDPQGGWRHPHRADRGAGRRRDRDVRHGRGRRHLDAVGRPLETAATW